MEEFSFPTITIEQDSRCHLSFPHFETSPLWLFSSTLAEQHKDKRNVKFSLVDEALQTAEVLRVNPELKCDDVYYRSREDEERMDILWENFNEELSRVSCDNRNRANLTGSGSLIYTSKSDREQQFKSGSIIRRRENLMWLLKMLRKLFLIQKVHTSQRTTLCAHGHMLQENIQVQL